MRKPVCFYERFAAIFNALGPSVLQHLQIPIPQLPVLNDHGQPLERDPLSDFRAVGLLARAAGFASVYVLVDRVDETAYTSNDVDAQYALVGPLLNDLRIQQIPPYCFKFFLPIDLETKHRLGGRPDRIHQFVLRWNAAEIEEMLGARLSAYSGGRVTKLITLLQDPTHISFVDNVVVRLAEESPRDLVRLLNTILNEEMRYDPSEVGISAVGLLRGIDAFCAQRTDEIVDRHLLEEIKRIQRVDFTINELATDVFKKGPQAAASRIRTWESAGVIQRVQDARSSGSKPPNRYAVRDARVARVICGGDVLDFLLTKMRPCPSCSGTVLRDWDEHEVQICDRYSQEFTVTV